VTGRGHHELPGREVDHGERHRRQPPSLARCEVVEHLEHLTGPLRQAEVGPDGASQLAHGGGRDHVVALHVTDHERHLAVTQGHEVVEVPSDLGEAARGDVAGRGNQPLDSVEPLGQEALLEGVGDGELLVGAAGPVDD